MNKQDVKNGLIVKLKSGGPNMVVYGQEYPYSPSFEIQCAWFGPFGSMFSDHFAPEALVIVEENNNGQKT